MECVITQSENEAVKLEVAKMLDPVSNIVALYESYKAEGRLNDLKFQINSSRRSLETMIKVSTSLHPFI